MVRIQWSTVLGFALGVAGPIALPLLVERLAPPAPPARRIYVPESFVETAAALDRYMDERGRLATEDDGLAALVPDYLPELPRDPWTHAPYVYEPAADGQSAELLSYGADGSPGGDGPDADISLRALSMGPPPPPPEPAGAWLVNASFLLTPLLAFVYASRWRLAAAALAGTACFAGSLLASVALARANDTELIVAAVSAVAAITAGVLVLRGRRGANSLALLVVGVVWAQLALLAT